MTDGLLGHWTMDTASVQGKRVADTSGGGNDGTILGTPPAVVPGRFGEALGYPASSASTGHLLCFNTGSNNDCWGIDDPGLRDRWVHAVALFRDGPLWASELYVDGNKRVLTCTSAPGQSCDTVRTVGLPLSLGGRSDFFFHGRLDDVRVYRRALDAVEVAALFDGTACP